MAQAWERAILYLCGRADPPNAPVVLLRRIPPAAAPGRAVTAQGTEQRRLLNEDE
ncbi:MAG: hypothetical protein ACHQ01_01275 [Candidatus Limnocylindrales bacterium]